MTDLHADRALYRRRSFFAVAAVLVVLLGILAGGWWLFGRRDFQKGPPAVGPMSGPMSVWPESPLADANALERAQANVLTGRDPWRLRPEATATGFVTNVLGWDAFRTLDLERHGHAAATITVARCDTPDDCRGGASASEPSSSITELISLRQLGRGGPGGVWSVVAATSTRLRLPVEPGGSVSSGAALPVGLSMSPDEHAAVGLTYDGGGFSSPTCEPGFAGEAGITATTYDLVVPGVPNDEGSCSGPVGAGYVFAYTTPRVTVQTGDPLLESAPIAELSIVPVAYIRGPSPSPGASPSPTSA